jgi:hypothetical protein
MVDDKVPDQDQQQQRQSSVDLTPVESVMDVQWGRSFGG